MHNISHFEALTQDREDSLRLLNNPTMRGIRASVVEKYSEKAHFIYELLQNADDAQASETRFLLKKEGLYFAHNGTTYFTVSHPEDRLHIGHINAITAIGDSTKNIHTKIGKFGIGFKAVFQYTNTPHIYDPNIAFKIRDLIVPVLLPNEAHPLRQTGETLFFLPFDRPEKTAAVSFEEIAEKLKNLLFPLLFLQNLKKITWETAENIRGTYTISEEKEISKGNIVQTIAKRKTEQSFLRFVRPIADGQNVQTVFFIDAENGLQTSKKFPAFCFFPTKVTTGLRFAVHAPFLLNDNREGIRQKEGWNEQLVQHLAILIADSLEKMSENPDFLPENLFSVFPFDRSELDNMFVPIVDALIQKLNQVPLLPTSTNTKVLLRNAYLAEKQDITQSFPNEKLQTIFGEAAHWVFTDVHHHTKFWHTIRTHLTANKTSLTAEWLDTHRPFEAIKVENTPENTPPSVSDTLQAEIVEIWDTLDDDTREKLMKSAEPNATYAAWDEVRDFDLVGLEAFFMREMTLERSVFLWHFLIEYFENQVFTAENLEGHYTFCFQTEKTVRFEAMYWRRLKNAEWIFDKNFEKNAPPSVSPENIAENYTRHALLEAFLWAKNTEKIDRFVYLTDAEKQAIEVGKRFLEQGFSTDDLLELRRIKAYRTAKEKAENKDFITEKIQKKRQKTDKKAESEEDDTLSSTAFLEKQQALRDDLEAELADKIADLVAVETLKEQVQAAEKYSMLWFKAVLSLEYLLAYEKQEKAKSIQIHFEKIEKEADTDKTILLKRPSRPLPYDIEEANDMTLKMQVGQERRNVIIEVVSIKDAGLRAKLKTPNEIADIDFSTIRGATLDIQNTIFTLEELQNAFNELPFDDDFNIQTHLPKDIRFIFGPPGTGKTTHLAYEEIQTAMLADDDFRILVVTPTNKSADVLVQKVMQYCSTPEGAPRWLMRFGTTAESSIENAGLLCDMRTDISEKNHFCVVSTITRFPYDGFNNGAWDYRLKNIAWDIIIVDEASMIGVAQIAYLLMQQRQAQFIIGGDPFQIEPVVFAEEWKGENIYNMVRLDAFDPVIQRERIYPNPYTITNLTTQYRSLNTLGTLYSHFAYDGILRHKRFKEHQKALFLPNLPLKDINIIRFPSQKMEILYRPQMLNNSHYHLYSALLTVELTQYIVREAIKNNPDITENAPLSIGIICPYKAQATLVDKILASTPLNNKKIKVHTGTIHSFQGDECDIVLCLFNPPPQISKSPNAFLNKKNILNVAISRAKDYLILLLPDEYTEGVENLYQINRLLGIIKYYLAGVRQEYTSRQIEEIIFDDPTFLYENTFATTHQSVNIYTQPEKKYEIRIEEKAIDVQMHTKRDI